MAAPSPASVQTEADRLRFPNGENAGSRRRFLWLAAALLIGLLLSIIPLIPPQPADNAPQDGFSAERAMPHVAALAVAPRPIGSAANAMGRDYLAASLESLGLAPEQQSTTVPGYYEPDEVIITNVMARIPGRDSTGAIALVAHFDTVPETPGANDDAAGVAAVLEVARALIAGKPIRNDVVVLMTDGEEPSPRYGSTAFVEQHPWAADIRFVVNLEAAGSGGIAVLSDTTDTEGWSAREYASAATNPAAFSYLIETIELFGGVGTDLDPFRAAGVPGVGFAYLVGSSIYHTSADTIDTVGGSSVQHLGLNALETVRRVGDLDLATPPTGGPAVYFTVFTSVVVSYTAAWALAFALLAALVFTTATWRRRSIHRGSLAAGAAGIFILVAVVALGATLAWQMLTAVRSTPGVVEAYVYLAILLIGSALVLVGALRRVRMRFPSLDLVGGAVLCWVVLALVTALWLPGWSYLFVWPALAASVLLLVDSVRPAAVVAELALVAWVTMALLVPPIDMFFQMAQPRPGNLDSQITSVAAVALLLAGLFIVLVAVTMSRVGGSQRTPVQRP